jgi:dihydroorotate dehydrogenase (NAD+) catalytic subunit
VRVRAADFDFPVAVGRVTLRNPVIASSGTYGYGLEYRRYGDPGRLGAVVVKSLTVEPRAGHPAPRVTPVDDPPGSMLNAVGVPNPGMRAWAEEILPGMLAAGAPVVASVWGLTAEAIVASAEILSGYRGPMAWEVNLSCPNSEHGGPPVSHDPATAAAVCAAVRALAPDEVGVWAKLAPDAPDVPAVADACSRAGVDAVTVSNTLPAAAATGIEVPSNLGGGAGGLSGPVLRSIVEPMVGELASRSPHLPVLACGGVVSSEIALSYLDRGATAVQVGTASLYDPRACHKIARGLVRRLRERA